MKTLSHSWKQQGSISLWSYIENEKNYLGWNLTADTAGCESIILLIDSLSKYGPSSLRRVQLTAPSPAILRVPNNKRGEARYRAANKLGLAFSGDREQWLIQDGADSINLTFGQSWLTPLCNGLRDITKGNGDYAIGTSPKLWFWWQPGSTA